MIEVIHYDGMPLRHSAVGHFVIYEGAVILLCHIFGFFLQRLKITAIMLVVYSIIQRHEFGSLFCNIVHDRLLETPAKIQILQPEQIALVLDTVKDGFKISNTGKYRRYKTDCADTGVIDLLHGGNSPFDGYSGIHVVLEVLIKRIDRP